MFFERNSKPLITAFTIFYISFKHYFLHESRLFRSPTFSLLGVVFQSHLRNERTNKEELLFLLFENKRWKENIIFYIISLVVTVMNTKCQDLFFKHPFCQQSFKKKIRKNSCHIFVFVSVLFFVYFCFDFEKFKFSSENLNKICQTDSSWVVVLFFFY